MESRWFVKYFEVSDVDTSSIVSCQRSAVPILSEIFFPGRLEWRSRTDIFTRNIHPPASRSLARDYKHPFRNISRSRVSTSLSYPSIQAHLQFIFRTSFVFFLSDVEHDNFLAELAQCSFVSWTNQCEELRNPPGYWTLCMDLCGHYFRWWLWVLRGFSALEGEKFPSRVNFKGISEKRAESFWKKSSFEATLVGSSLASSSAR